MLFKNRVNYCIDVQNIFLKIEYKNNFYTINKGKF